MKQNTDPLNMESDKKIKLDVVSGFLGAGKTTFILKMIRDIFDKENVVVLENEFGKISFDGETLTRQGIAVESVCAGCICCTSAGKLSQNLISIADKYHPDRIVIEPTGLARLSDVIGLLAEPYISDRCEIDHVATIVDAKNYDNRMMISKEFFENQIRNSKLIFLSKTETLEQSRRDEITRLIHEIHPGCTVISQAWQQMTADQMKNFIGYTSDVLIGENHHLEEHDHNHAGFESFTFEADTPTERDEITEFLKNIVGGSCGEIHRIKGVFQDSKTRWYCFEYVPGEMKIVPITQEMARNSKKLQACVIGVGLKKDLILAKIS